MNKHFFPTASFLLIYFLVFNPSVGAESPQSSQRTFSQRVQDIMSILQQKTEDAKRQMNDMLLRLRHSQEANRQNENRGTNQQQQERVLENLKQNLKTMDARIDQTRKNSEAMNDQLDRSRDEAKRKQRESEAAIRDARFRYEQQKRQMQMQLRH